MKAPYIITPVKVDSSFDPAQWFVTQAQQHGLCYLLVHADDGIIWGRIDGASLHTSHGIAPTSPLLRAVTLQQARLFGPKGELLVWRIDNGWSARLVTDVDGNSDDVIDEDQILWGDTVESTHNGFTLVREGSQGMRHAVPVTVTPDRLTRHELRLRVRHYMTENDDGEARIALSRLVQVLPESV